MALIYCKCVLNVECSFEGLNNDVFWVKCSALKIACPNLQKLMMNSGTCGYPKKNSIIEMFYFYETFLFSFFLKFVFFFGACNIKHVSRSQNAIYGTPKTQLFFSSSSDFFTRESLALSLTC